MSKRRNDGSCLIVHVPVTMILMQNECDTCAYCAYDEEYGDYVCEIDMDEDDYAKFLADPHYSCPFYRNGDEYAVVRHQM